MYSVLHCIVTIIFFCLVGIVKGSYLFNTINKYDNVLEFTVDASPRISNATLTFSLTAPDSAKSKIEKFSKIKIEN